MIEKFINSLREIENPRINSNYDLQTWQAKATNLLNRIYGENSKQEEQIKQIRFRNYMKISTIGGSSNSSSGGGNNSKHCENQVKELIASFIYDLETYGLPKEKEIQEKGGINISVNQNQTVNLNIIWNLIKDELTRTQVREVEEIINGNDKPASKKKKIINKLKSFGSDVASNIVASLLTNPSIYGL